MIKNSTSILVADDDSNVLKDSDTVSPVTPSNKLITESDVTGGGDMSKSTYDSNNSGIVDNSEKVNNLTVETAVPSGAKFTDTVYDDTTIQAAVALNTAKVGITPQQAADIVANNLKVSNVDHPLVETAVPANAVFTDTTYTNVSELNNDAGYLTEGAKGDDGESAYQVAVSNGFSGTEPEWLDSLKGADGVQGIQGIPGNDGSDGSDGDCGAARPVPSSPALPTRQESDRGSRPHLADRQESRCESPGRPSHRD